MRATSRAVAYEAPSRAARAQLEYLVVVPVRVFRTGPGRCATESAFAAHLRALLASLAPHVRRITLAAPTMSAAAHERLRGSLGELDEVLDRVRFVPLYPGDAGRVVGLVRHGVPTLRNLWRAVRNADVVHAGTSHDLFRPIEIMALLMAHARHLATVCVIDIDLSNEAAMRRRTGSLGWRSHQTSRLVYDPLRRLQQSTAARRCSLVLVKGERLRARLAASPGAERANVHGFLDAAFSERDVIGPAALDAKLRTLAQPTHPLELVYFGRLTAYKGVDRCIEALALASRATPAPMRLTIIGSGEAAGDLQRLCAQRGLDTRVAFQPALPFGEPLFERVRPLHLLLAAPLSEDTPRSAIDAMACGVPLLAFDTEYYRDLAASGAVELVPWPSVEHLARRIVELANDKSLLVPRVHAAVEFARANTQESWLERRARWTLAAVEKHVAQQVVKRVEEGRS